MIERFGWPSANDPIIDYRRVRVIATLRSWTSSVSFLDWSIIAGRRGGIISTHSRDVWIESVSSNESRS